jgi:nucleoid DNA-binding protein
MCTDKKFSVQRQQHEDATRKLIEEEKSERDRIVDSMRNSFFEEKKSFERVRADDFAKFEAQNREQRKVIFI